MWLISANLLIQVCNIYCARCGWFGITNINKNWLAWSDPHSIVVCIPSALLNACSNWNILIRIFGWISIFVIMALDAIAVGFSLVLIQTSLTTFDKARINIDSCDLHSSYTQKYWQCSSFVLSCCKKIFDFVHKIKFLWSAKNNGVKINTQQNIRRNWFFAIDVDFTLFLLLQWTRHLWSLAFCLEDIYIVFCQIAFEAKCLIQPKYRENWIFAWHLKSHFVLYLSAVWRAIGSYYRPRRRQNGFCLHRDLLSEYWKDVFKGVLKWRR